MKYVLVLLVLVLSTSVASGKQESVRGKFQVLDKKEELVEGDFFKYRLELWPLGYIDKENIRDSLKNRDFLNYFKIIDARKILKSENNSDVLVIEGVAVLIKFFVERDFYIWSYDGANIPIELKIGQVAKNNEKEESTRIYEATVDSNMRVNWFLVMIILIILMIIGFTLYGRYENQKKKILSKRIREEKKNRWIKMFRLAKRREDYERIYKYREEWIDDVGSVAANQVNEFMDILDLYQYKKIISKEELLEIEKSFDNVRQVFK